MSISNSLSIDRLPVFLKRLLWFLEIDRAVFFGVLAKLWSICTGPVTAILIAIYFTPELQGYYYTFATILALQIFVELGLGTVIIQFASHEWSKLKLDKFGHIMGSGDALSRLGSIADLASKWYMIAGAIATFGLGAAGYVFFSGSDNSTISWAAPWFVLCFITGVNICLVPIWSLLEGCNQVSQLYTYRFWQGVVVGVTCWAAILLGAQLWTAVIVGIATLVCAGVFLRYRYWNFIKGLLFTRHPGPRVYWRTEMLPMQWRIAISWISGYFIFSLFTPVLLKYDGPVVAGQMGMTWNLLAIVGVATSWLFPKVPRFGMLIAEKRYQELDALFWKVVKVVAAISTLLALAVFCFVWVLNELDIFLAARLLPPVTVGLFLLAQVVSTASIPFSVYLRAHKKEPLMFLSVLIAIITALSTLILGKYFSALGMASGYLLINLLITPLVLIVWWRCRAEWHA